MMIRISVLLWLYAFAQPQEGEVLVLPTEGQDKGECAILRMPDQIYLSPDVIHDWGLGWSRHGRWQTFDGGTLAVWKQTNFGERTGLEVSIGTKILAKVNVLDITNEKVRLEAVDCNDDPLMIIDEESSGDAPYNLYLAKEDGTAGNLLCKGTQGELKKDEYHWETATGDPAAIATRWVLGVDDEAVAFNGMLRWHMDLVIQKNKTLDRDHLGWYLALATQVRAVRNADRVEGLVMEAPLHVLSVIGGYILDFSVLIFVFIFICVMYLWIYPKNKSHENRFMRPVYRGHDSSLYGTFHPQTGPMAAPQMSGQAGQQTQV